MSDKNTGGSAFPTADAARYPDLIGGGMSLRDYFAAKAMAALIVNPSEMNSNTFSDVIVGAYQYADAMLTERAK